jgi:protein TonB
MRDRASRVIGYAVLASLLLHALVFYVLPVARELNALLPQEAEPLIARVEHLEPPPPPPVPFQAAPRKPVPPPSVQKTMPEPAPAPRLEPMSPLPPQPASAEPAPALAPAPVAQVAPAAPAAAPPAPPPPALDPRLRSDYAQRITAAAERYKVYPRVAIDNNWRGEVELVMAIGADGRVASLRVTKSSGHRVLDDQALDMFARAKPGVRLPAALRGQAFELELRAVFRLEG